jgi:GNAT superfamily N-acetyltransferase
MLRIMPHRYPQEAVLRDGRHVLIRPFNVDSRAVIEGWGRNIDHAKVFPLLAVDGQHVVADATLHRLGGPLRLVGRVKWMLDPAYRGVGLGTTLVNHLITIARERGLRHVNSMLISDLEADAVKTLETLGFRSFVQPGYGTDPDGNQHDMTKLILKL